MIISDYFKLTDRQAQQFAALDALYRDWNSKINVISRKDIDNLYEHHVLHSLAIAKLLPFQPGTTIMDVGTGGGFPGIPLAILFPECQFLLIDSIGSGKCFRFDERCLQTGARGRRETEVRLRRLACRDASTRLGQTCAEEHLQ